MNNHLGTWTGRDPLVDEEGVYEATVEQKAAASRVLVREGASDLLEYLGLAS